MSTAEEIADDIRSSSSYVTEAVAENLYALGYSRTGRPTLAGILLDLHNHSGEYTPDHVAEYLHALGYSKRRRMTQAEVQAAFDRGTEKWREDFDNTGRDTIRMYWAEELGIKVVD